MQKYCKKGSINKDAFIMAFLIVIAAASITLQKKHQSNLEIQEDQKKQNRFTTVTENIISVYDEKNKKDTLEAFEDGMYCVMMRTIDKRIDNEDEDFEETMDYCRNLYGYDGEVTYAEKI